MRPFTTVAQRSLTILAVACSVSVLACSSDKAGQPSGSGGAGSGGTSGSGGSVGSGGHSTAGSDAAVVTGTGGAPGSGGATVPAGTGGNDSAGGKARSGGATTGNGGAAGAKSGTGGAIGGGGGTTTPPGTGGAGGGSTGTSAQPVPSEGCGKAPPASDRYNIQVGGKSREYILKVPDGYDKKHPYRLIFGFHGAKYDDNWVATGKAPDGGTPLSGPWFGIESESQGSAIFVAPQASGTWATADLDFVDEMLKKFEAEMCIDKSRIFSVGFSMGAIMTIRIGCNRSSVFRGIAPMSGALQEDCPDGQHVAYWASHGTKDTTIDIKEGQAARDAFVTRNHCTTQTSTPNSDNCVTYQGCDQGYPVSWCTFPGVHEPAPFAGPEIWSFISPL